MPQAPGARDMVGGDSSRLITASALVPLLLAHRRAATPVACGAAMDVTAEQRILGAGVGCRGFTVEPMARPGAASETPAPVFEKLALASF